MNIVRIVWSKKKMAQITCAHAGATNPLTILNLSKENDAILNDDTDNNIVELFINDVIDINPDRFIEEYRDIIGHISETVNSLEWWSTHTASKNRFTSTVPTLLHQIDACSITIKKELHDLIIYRPDCAIVPTLQDMISNSDSKSSLSQLYCHIKPRISRLWSLFRHIRAAIMMSYRIMILRVFYKKPSFKNRSLKTYALKTFFYNSTINEKSNFSYHDPMYGRLPEYLRQRGNLIIITNIIGKYKQCIAKINSNNEYCIYPIEYWLTFTTIVSRLLFIIKTRLEYDIPNDIVYRGLDVSKIFKTQIYIKYNDISLTQYLYYDMMKGCISSLKIDQYIHTYENNPWEKMSIAAIRDSSNDTKIMGYQHAVIPQSSVNVFNSRSELKLMPLPDKILCVGAVPLEIINKYSVAQSGLLDVSCGLRYEYLDSLTVKKRNNIQNILIIPEGVISVAPMIDYVMKELASNLEYTMNIRFHPALPYKSINSHLCYDLKKIKNLSISEAPLKDDLMNADICIYWGSTVSLEALSMGIPAIHYCLNTVLSYDPLFQCNSNKWTIKNNMSLIDILKHIESIRDEEYSAEAHHAKAYIKHYFYSVTNNNMSKFIL